MNKIRRPFTPKGSSEKQAVLSNRHHNIPLYASIGEIIDNSIEWKAKNIHIYVKWKEILGQIQDEQPNEIVFINDGIGMDKDRLSNSLVAGFHDPNEEGNDRIGKFGVGSTYAFLSNCRKSEVYSKENGGDWYYTCFDIDAPELDDPSKVYPPDAIKKEPPKEYKDIWGKVKSGTITVWSKFDKGHTETDDENEIPFWISRAYRKFIGKKIVVCKEGKNENNRSVVEENKNPINIYYNDELLRAYDPLYAIPYREKDKEGGKLLTPIIIRLPIGKGDEIGKIILQIGLCPEEWRKYNDQSPKSSAKDPINVKERYIRGASGGGSNIMDSRKMSILRDNREVSWLHDGFLVGRTEDIDRWWGLEIMYDSCLDDYFNVKNVKYQVELTKEMRSKFRKEIINTINQLRKEISGVFELDQAKNKKEKQEKEKKGGISIEVEKEDVENAGDTDEAPNELLKKFIETSAERKKILEELSDRKFIKEEDFKKRIPKDTNLLFEYAAKGGEVLMIKYANHPWFSKMEEIENELKSKAQKGSISPKELEEEYHEIRILWELLLQTLVIALANVSPNEIQQKIIDRLLSNWGQLALKYVEKREVEKLDED